MERYTNPDCKPEMEELMKDCPRSRSGAECWLRLCDIEDILGDEYDLDELREMVQAKREGRCVVLPAKVDETVYQVKKGDDCPCCFRLEGVNISEDGDITYPIYWGESFTPDDFGNKLFKTHNEAMAALRREQE